MKSGWDQICQIAGFGADLVAISAGLLGFLAAIFKREEISQFFGSVRFARLFYRTKDIINTLNRLSVLDYDDKAHRSQIMALFGELRGKIHSLQNELPELGPIHLQLTEWLDKKVSPSEPLKRDLVEKLQNIISDRFTISEPIR